MGTRNLTVVCIDGEYKVAQYGQWDGYPEGQGITALQFMRKICDDTELMNEFKEKVRAVQHITQADAERIERIEDWPSKYPELSRDRGAEILYA